MNNNFNEGPLNATSMTISVNCCRLSEFRVVIFVGQYINVSIQRGRKYNLYSKMFSDDNKTCLIPSHQNDNSVLRKGAMKVKMELVNFVHC